MLIDAPTNQVKVVEVKHTKYHCTIILKSGQTLAYPYYAEEDYQSKDLSLMGWVGELQDYRCRVGKIAGDQWAHYINEEVTE